MGALVWKKEYNYHKGKTCKDCGKSISNRAIRCQKCSGIIHREYKASPETLEKLRISHLGQVSWNKGMKGFLSGEQHYNWKGGWVEDGYSQEFNKALKEQIRFRDKYKCRECGCPQIENGKSLGVHHIDYDKKNSNFNNLISLCVSCHTKTLSKREYWENHFKEILTECLL
jgi:hypothetical protein